MRPNNSHDWDALLLAALIQSRLCEPESTQEFA